MPKPHGCLRFTRQRFPACWPRAGRRRRRKRMAEVINLYDTNGHRKFTTRAERDCFLRAAAVCLGEIRTLCSVLAYTGCHLTEALELTFERVDMKHQALIF